MDKIFKKLLLLQLLWQVGGVVNFNRLIELSKYIRHREDIRSLVVFSQKSFVQDLSGYEKFLHSQSSTLPMVLIADDYTEAESLSRLLGHWSIVFVFMDDVDSLNMLAIVDENLTNIHSSKFVFILKRSLDDGESLIRFFKACLRLGIVNVIVMADNQVLSYEPYPSVVMENLTLAPIEAYYADRLYNLKGYTFYSPMAQDGARVYLYYDAKGQPQATGVNTQIFRSFVKRHNATFQRLLNVNNQSSIDIPDGFTLLRKGKIDIFAHSFSSYFNPKFNFAWSYPIAQVRWLAVVPYVGEISSFMYLILPFDRQVWISLGVSFLYISLAGYITLRYCQRLTEYGPVFSRSLTQFLYMPSILAPCNLQAVFFEMQIICYGLILTNVYLAFLSAFLTTTVQGNQIDTLEELYDSGIKIMTTPFESTLIRGTIDFQPRFDDIFRLEEADLITEYRKRLDKNYAYIMAEDRANFFLGQQKYLEKKRWYVSKRSLGTYFLSFTLQVDSPFRKIFDMILMELYQTGLYTKWEQDVFDIAVATKFLRLYRSDSEDVLRPLTISHLFVCWMAYAVGIGLALGVLLLELVRFTVVKR